LHWLDLFEENGFLNSIEIPLHLFTSFKFYFGNVQCLSVQRSYMLVKMYYQRVYLYALVYGIILNLFYKYLFSICRNMGHIEYVKIMLIFCLEAMLPICWFPWSFSCMSRASALLARCVPMIYLQWTLCLQPAEATAVSDFLIFLWYFWILPMGKKWDYGKKRLKIVVVSLSFSKSGMDKKLILLLCHTQALAHFLIISTSISQYLYNI
jgi:hypothetical protein